MTSVAELAARIAGISEEAGRIASSLDYEAGESASAMHRVQSAFGDQEAGREAALRLDGALTHIAAAGTALRQEGSHAADLVARIRS